MDILERNRGEIDGMGHYVNESRGGGINCYVYGIGMQYNLLSSYLRLYEDKIKILALVTTESQSITHLDGKDIIRPWEMNLDEMDYVIVAMKQYKEVFGILKELGISDKILRSEIFSIPNFVLEDYLRLRESRPSILSNTCIGGLVYHMLGLELLSPTIAMIGGNYIQFLKNYKSYLSIDIKAEEKDCLCGELHHKAFFAYRGFFAPKGRFGDSVLWYFLHAVDGRDEVEKWNRRRKKINYGNIIALMIIMTDEEAYEFEKLPIQKKLGFYYNDLGLKSVLYTPEWRDMSLRCQYRYQYHEFIHEFYAGDHGKRGKINWIRFLNGEKDFLRF